MRTTFVMLTMAATGLGGVVGCAVGWWTGDWLMFNLGAVSLTCSAPLLYLLRPSPLAELAGASGEFDRSHRPGAYRPPTDAPLDETGQLVEQLLQQGRYALVLRPQIIEQLTADQTERGQEMFDAALALVPTGEVEMLSGRPASVEDDESTAGELVGVEGFFLDRYPVTNAEYRAFVAAGGYEQMPLWEPDIWPAVVEFVDLTGHSGPAHWAHGTYPPGQDDHPVVGVSWYEAAAYARWVGKRLPTDAEWVKAAAWPVRAGGQLVSGRRYPWGDDFDRTRANVWGGAGRTVPVTAHASGVSVGGVHQLTGNVWEWTDTRYGVWDPRTREFTYPQPLKSLRGGAFDTYFDTQAASQFQSGDNPLARKHNIGFRCAASLCDVVTSLDSSRT